MEGQREEGAKYKINYRLFLALKDTSKEKIFVLFIGPV